jgi:hypothetical protein
MFIDTNRYIIIIFSCNFKIIWSGSVAVYKAVPELAPQRKQTCADNKRVIKFLISPIPKAHPQALQKIRSVTKQQQKISDIAKINKMFGQLEF